MSADESVNNAERLADYWVFGGIFRPVYLEAVLKQHVDHIVIDAKADGSFAMNVFTSAGEVLAGAPKLVRGYLRTGEDTREFKDFITIRGFSSRGIDGGPPRFRDAFG